jgi:hypothetical protein
VKKLVIIILALFILILVLVFFLISHKAKVSVDGKFGFLRNVSDLDQEKIEETGATWLRPNFGDFVWGEMQKSKDDPINFTATDKVVGEAKKHGLSLVVTLFPYADWDQAGDSKCKVLTNDKMLPREKGNFKISGLPYYRCNPHDWDLYEKWLTAVVKRYEKDILYFEIDNEPDLTRDFNQPGMVFYLDTPENYAKLLQISYTTIKNANSKAQILIAAPAGSQSQFQGFWAEVFSTPQISNSFDIGNIHSLSAPDQNENSPISVSAEDLNVTFYKNLLAKYNITKTIWVTEAENIQGNDVQDNVKRLSVSVTNALKNGAEKIFFTGASFSDDPMKYTSEILISEKSYYKTIISSH